MLTLYTNIHRIYRFQNNFYVYIITHYTCRKQNSIKVEKYLTMKLQILIFYPPLESVSCSAGYNRDSN